MKSVILYNQMIVLKKLAAIFLILVLLFNWYGYRFVTEYLQHQSDKNLEAKLDGHNYDESQLYEIRIPLNMPYQSNSTEYERQYGEIEIDGNAYTYVKRKIEDGFLVLKCIPNSGKQEVKKINTDFFKLVNGLDQDQNGKKQQPSNFFKNLLSEYDAHVAQFNISSLSALHKEFIHASNQMLPEIFLSTLHQPPKSIVVLFV